MDAGRVADISASPFPAVDDRLNDWLISTGAKLLSRGWLRQSTGSAASTHDDLVELSDTLKTSLSAESMDGRFGAVTETLALGGMRGLHSVFQADEAVTETLALGGMGGLHSVFQAEELTEVEALGVSAVLSAILTASDLTAELSGNVTCIFMTLG